jgi:hypothetical protein
MAEEKVRGVTGNGTEVEQMEEWWQQDRGDALGWALAFIWAALVVLAEVTGYAGNYSWWDGWGVFFAGAGAIMLGGTLIRMLVPEYSRPGVAWGLVCGAVMLGIGLGDLAAWIWPLLLASIAGGILWNAFVRGR